MSCNYATASINFTWVGQSGYLKATGQGNGLGAQYNIYISYRVNGVNYLNPPLCNNGDSVRVCIGMDDGAQFFGNYFSGTVYTSSVP